jgi:anti-sigma regulatory factor (Ser/Thr protein kinase)
MAGCDRAARLSSQLLTLARLEAGALQTRMVACDLVPVARDVLAELASDALARRATFELAGDESAVIRGDETLLRVLLRNLGDNAIRYGPAGGHVRVSLHADGDTCELRVADEGPGLAPSEAARVSDRFCRGSQTSESGGGLGLSIAKRIAELHAAERSAKLPRDAGSKSACASPRSRLQASSRARDEVSRQIRPCTSEPQLADDEGDRGRIDSRTSMASGDWRRVRFLDRVGRRRDSVEQGAAVRSTLRRDGETRSLTRRPNGLIEPDSRFCRCRCLS